MTAREIFGLMPFQKEIIDSKGQKKEITSFAKILEVNNYDGDELKPIEFVKILEVNNLEGFVTLENYIKIDTEIENICQYKLYSWNSLPEVFKILIDYKRMKDNM